LGDYGDVGGDTDQQLIADCHIPEHQHSGMRFSFTVTRA
jgi:hypothetical protein